MQTLTELVQTNLILFTSTGLWGLTLNNRYTHTIGRLREFYDKKCSTKELAIMASRCYILKVSFVCLIISVLVGILHVIGGVIFPESSVYLIGTYCIFLFISMFCLLLDVVKSFNATLIHIKE